MTYFSLSEIIDELFLFDDLFAAWLSLACVNLGGVVKFNAIGNHYLFSNNMLLYVELDWSPLINVKDFEYRKYFVLLILSFGAINN